MPRYYTVELRLLTHHASNIWDKTWTDFSHCSLKQLNKTYQTLYQISQPGLYFLTSASFLNIASRYNLNDDIYHRTWIYFPEHNTSDNSIR